MIEPSEPETLAAKLHKNRRLLVLIFLVTWLLFTLVPSAGLPAVAEDVAAKLLGWIAVASMLLALYFESIYRAPATSQAVEASRKPQAVQFWADAVRRRNYFLASWIGWLVAGPVLWAFWSFVLRSAEPMEAMFAALFTWAPVFFWCGWRFSSTKCFNCGERAFGHFPIRMTRASCKNCGTPYVAT